MRELLNRPFLLLVLAVLAAGAYQYGGTAANYAVHGLPVGAGAAAKLGCSFHFVTGRSPEQVRERDLRPLNPVLGLFELDVDPERQRVTASAWGLVSRVAQHRPGYGCTLLPDEATELPALALERHRPELPDFADAEPSAALLRAVEAEFEREDTRAVLVLRDGVRLVERYAEGFDADTRLISWSMAKSVTATAVAMLVQRGALDWQQDGLFSEWAEDARARIKLIDLMHMSSGLGFSERYGPGSDVTNMLFAEGDMAAFVAASALEAEPGTQFKYSSGTTVLLMRLVRETLGSEAAHYRFLHSEVLDGLGMVDALFEADAAGVAVGSSYLFATAPDYARFGQFTLELLAGAPQPALPPDWAQMISTPAPAAEQGQYAAQFWLNTAGTRFAGVPRDAVMALGHNGQLVAVLPSERVVLVRLGWSTDGSFRPEDFVSSVHAALQAGDD